MGQTISINIKSLSKTPVLDDSDAYQVNDCIGGLLTFSDILVSENGEISHNLKLNSVILNDLDNQAVDYDILFFKDNPSSSTINDDSAIDIHHDDSDKVIGSISINSGDFVNLSSSGTVNVRNVNLYLSPTQRDLFVAIVTRGTPTFSTDHSITLILNFSLN